ncbi:MAG: rubredoxin [Bacteroidetes bacterium]|nr:rubredoxin [Bacteroidota bacterium]
MNKYKCLVCGYIYDEAKGDPKNGVDPGTLYDDIPEDWQCPVCDATIDYFNEI